jgi:DNA-binding SARP family transcriptional activator
VRIRTFGGLWIEADPAVPPLGPRRMAILALVAAAGRRGITRERIIGILWADTGEGPARHALSQHLYALRRETGRDWIVANPELHLDPAISSDIGEFQDALAADDMARAAGLYSGAFLEGFYLQGFPEFERWVEEERARLQGVALRALERLATQADESGGPGGAVAWWRRLAELDPLSDRYAAGLMRSLAAAGDQSSALAHARRHQALVRRELDADSDPIVQALAATLRTPASAAAEPAPRPAHIPPADAAAPEAPMPQAPAARRPAWRPLAALLGLVAILVLIVQQVRGNGSDPPLVAVGVVRPADTSLVSGVLRDMLATSLARIPGLQVVANSRVVELMPRGADTIPGATSEAALRAGASEILEGEVFPAPGGLGMTLRRVALVSGVVRRGYTVRGADVIALIDSATAVIARDLGLEPPAGSVATIRTSSPAAYALYEQGLRAYYQYDAPAALRLMRAAIERDSTFAMAAWYGWRASLGLIGTPEGDPDLLRLAQRLAPRTIDRERLLITGSVAAVTAPLSTVLAVAETLTIRFPADPDGQIMLGQARHAAGDWPGAVAALERAVRLDSVADARSKALCRLCVALDELTTTYLWWDSAAAAERTARRLIALRPDVDGASASLATPLLRMGRRAEAAAVLRSVPRGMFQRDLIRTGQFEEVDRELIRDMQSPSLATRSTGRWLMLISLRNQGRFREAMALAREGTIPGGLGRAEGLPAEGTNLAILAMEGGRPLEAARHYRAILAQHLAQGWSPGFQARYGTWVLALAGTALAAAGDTVGVLRLADSAELMGRESNFGRDPRLHHFLRGLVEQRRGRQAEAVESFRRAVFSATDGYTRINLEMARSLMALGRPAEAVAALQPALRGGVDGSNTYVTHTELHEALAQAFELAGQADSARAHYRAVVAALRHADPPFTDRYARARAKAQLPSQ